MTCDVWSPGASLKGMWFAFRRSGLGSRLTQSSPRRSTRRRRLTALRQDSSVPAGPAVGVAWDRPRACGEQAADQLPSRPRAGPSPRVRGAERLRPLPGQQVGTIPARAGSRLKNQAGEQRVGDHPRACGEQSRKRSAESAVPGPSPRVRGAAFPLCHTGNVPGTIPARAGSSTSPTTSAASSRDHPRACGEQPNKVFHGSTFWGPSPRVRGAEERGTQTRGCRGTIPARAGSRGGGQDRGHGGRDHPRACGEQTWINRHRHLCRGPSPRVRGAVVTDDLEQGRLGTIPARAGSSLADLRVYCRRDTISVTFADSGQWGICGKWSRRRFSVDQGEADDRM